MKNVKIVAGINSGEKRTQIEYNAQWPENVQEAIKVFGEIHTMKLIEKQLTIACQNIGRKLIDTKDGAIQANKICGDIKGMVNTYLTSQRGGGLSESAKANRATQRLDAARAEYLIAQSETVTQLGVKQWNEVPDSFRLMVHDSVIGRHRLAKTVDLNK